MTTPRKSSRRQQPPAPRSPADDHAAERPQAEELLGTLHHQPPMVAFWGLDQRNQFASRAYSEWYHLDRTDLTGKDIRTVFGPEDTEHGMPHVRAALAGSSRASRGPTSTISAT